jgi:mitotic spindle assembly checkpoint protein MAD1
MEGNLHRLSESSKREKKNLIKKLSYMKEDLSRSASKNNVEARMFILLQYLFVVAC